jgi:murein DD-endopeptidase MepM/ murein hydrolase activator NlpD
MRILFALVSCALLALAALFALGDGTPWVRVQRTSTGAGVAPAPTTTAGETAVPAARSPRGTRQGGVPSMETGAAIPTGEATNTAPRQVATPASAAPAQAAATPSSPVLLLPVQGVRPDQIHDTFADARNEGRSHDAIDIMAPAGTPVLAVADGTVEKLFDSQRGGLTVYQFEPGGRLAYYYAHLQRYADGLAEGQAVKRGQLIGYVGSTGNASPDAPHLHFAIFVLGPERRWWEGTAVNPYPVLRGEAPLP